MTLARRGALARRGTLRRLSRRGTLAAALLRRRTRLALVCRLLCLARSGVTLRTPRHPWARRQDDHNGQQGTRHRWSPKPRRDLQYTLFSLPAHTSTLSCVDRPRQPHSTENHWRYTPRNTEGTSFETRRSVTFTHLPGKGGPSIPEMEKKWQSNARPVQIFSLFWRT